MSAKLPDIELLNNKILGVDDFVGFGGACWYDMPVSQIVENAVMGVTDSKNPHLALIINDIKTKFDFLTTNATTFLEAKKIFTYNTIFQLLEGTLISNDESTFSHHKSHSLNQGII